MRGFRAKVAGVSYYMMQRSGSRTSIRSSFLAAWRKRTECVRRRSLLEEHEEGERCVLHPEIRSLLRLSLCCCCCRRLRPTVWGWSSTTRRESCYHSLGLFPFHILDDELLRYTYLRRLFLLRPGRRAEELSLLFIWRWHNGAIIETIWAGT